MNELEHRYYRYSGAVPATSTLMMLGIGFVACGVLGLLFELLKHYVPYDIVRFAAALGYGALVGLTVQLSARIAHVRNPGFARFVGFVIGLFAVYAAWVWFLWILFGFRGAVLQALVTRPGLLFDNMQFFAANGLWKIRDMKPTGWWLYGIWLTEALMILGFAVALSANKNASYCEACRKWTRKFDLLLHLPVVDPESLKAALEAENYEPLYRLVGKPFNMVQRIDVTAVKCPNCTESNFLTVALTTITNNGEQDVAQVHPIVKHLVVPYDVIETLKGRQPAMSNDETSNDEGMTNPE